MMRKGPAMQEGFLEPFMRRHNSDGSWDSICKCCFFTIATRKEQTDLELIERLHSCGAFALARDNCRRRSAARETEEV
jgi:hypothetical protein